VNIAGLASLTAIDGTIELDSNPALANLDGLQNLTSVGHTFYLNDCPELRTLSPLSRLEHVGALSINNCAGLVDLDGLEQLTSVGDYAYSFLALAGNPALTSLAALSALKEVDGAVSIQENAALGDLHGFEGLERIGSYFWLSSNPSLASLRALAGVTRIEDYLSILDNSALPTCEAEWFRDNVDFIGGAVSISGNDSGGVCP
jgi:hypothetical protein